MTFARLLGIMIMGLVLCTTLTACSNTKSGNAAVKGVTEESLADKLVKGVTTQEDVERMFGEPTQTTRTTYTVGRTVEQGTQWIYSYSETHGANIPIPFLPSSVSSHGNKGTTLFITFNKDRKVFDYYVNTQNRSWDSRNNI